MSLFRHLRKVVKTFLYSIRRFRMLKEWQNGHSPLASNVDFQAHLMVMNNAKYSDLAQICVTSFLHYHPSSTVLIHVDEKTIKSVSKWVSKSKFKNQINLILDHANSSLTWQEKKLLILSNLSETNEFFVDADMKWNGPLIIPPEKKNAVLFFVEEYKLVENETFNAMLKTDFFSPFRNASMWNTSFVRLSKVNIDENMLKEIFEIQKEIIAYAEKFIHKSSESNTVIRISEQLALSLAAESWQVELSAVKNADKYMDGAFLESSYFGATGSFF